jgi:type IV pilus assembly protein PilB
MRLSHLKKRLGDLLVEVGIITHAQLKEALDIQSRTGEKLGTILSHTGAINEEVMLAFLGKQCGVSYVSISEYGTIPDEILRTIPESVVRHQTLIPLSREDNVLTVAMADPFNIFAVDDIKLMTGYDVQVVISSESEIKAAIDRHYTARVVPSATLQASREQLLSVLLTQAIRINATEIHIEPQQDYIRIRHRVDGTLKDHMPLPREFQGSLFAQIKTVSDLTSLQQQLHREGRLKITVDEREYEFRVAILPSMFGERIVLQTLDPASLHMDINRLGFEPEELAIFKKNIDTTRGLIIVAGPIDSGKTTTLYSTLVSINQPDRNIITVEDPVEFVIPGISQIQVKPESGLSFPVVLRNLERQNPDVVMVGELSDQHTAKIAINTVLTGRLVFATLPTGDTVDTIIHLLNMGIEPFLISSTLTLVVAQRLMRALCRNCRTSYELSRSHLASIGIETSDEKTTLWRGTGCPQCNNTGYHGRTAVFELIEIDKKLHDLILERSSESALRTEIASKGMLTLREAAWKKVLSGVSTLEEMLRITKISSS